MTKVTVKMLWIFTGVILIVFGAALATVGQFLAAPAQAPVRADLIVALGGDGGYRIAKAYALYRQGYATRILLTGADGMPDETRNAYLGWRAQYLLDKGVSQDAILFDLRSTSSRDEAANTLAIMRREGLKTALVVSDPPHLRRLSCIWGALFSESGRSYVLVASEPPWWNAAQWWSHDYAAVFVLSEMVKLVYYQLR